MVTKNQIKNLALKDKIIIKYSGKTKKAYLYSEYFSNSFEGYGILLQSIGYTPLYNFTLAK